MEGHSQVELYEHQKKARERYRNSDEIPLFFEMGTGKGNPVWTSVLTRTGWVRMGDLAIGDKVISPIDGKEYPVTGIFNKGKRHVNRVWFTNGTSLLCDDEHLWNIQDNNQRYRGEGSKTVDMEYIKTHPIYREHGKGKEHKMYIPVNAPIEFTDAHYSDAYVMGVLIGDGALSNRMISVSLPEKDCLERFTRDIEFLGYTLHRKKSSNIEYNIVRSTAKKGFAMRIRELGLACKSDNKTIPEDYLFADIATRKALLEGLVNSDGYMEGGRVYYCSASQKLTKGIKFLVSSLGGVCTEYEPKETHYLKTGERIACKTSYRISFMLEGLNLSQKHSAKYKGQRKPYKAIERVVDAGEEECICIYIDSPDHLYIAGDWVTTHNTMTSTIIMCDKFKAGVIDSLLVIAPNDVHKQWYDDFTDSSSNLAIAVAQEGVEYDAQVFGGRGGQKKLFDFEGNGKLHIVCVNVDTFSTPHKWECVVEWVNANKTAIILDEATSVKNPSSKRSQRILYEFNAVSRRGRVVLKSEKLNPVRCALTGTPSTNGPTDLWGIMEFIRPNYFGMNQFSFENYFAMHTKLTVDSRTVPVLLTEKTWHGIRSCSSYAEAYNVFGCTEDTYLTVMHQDQYIGPYKHADQLKILLDATASYAKLTDCVDMPPRNYVLKKVPLSEAQDKCYKDMRNDFLARYGDYTATAKNKMIVTMRLQQIASGFIKAGKEMDWADMESLEDYDINPEEIVWLEDTNPRLEQLMRDVGELDKPLLIITRFSAEAAKIEELLRDKYSVMLFTGWKSTGTIKDFQDGKFEIMVANIRKIAKGFNLQIAHSTIYYSNTSSMEDREQSEFRTFRSGQKHSCSFVDYDSCQADRTIRTSLKMKKGMLDYLRGKNIKELV